MNTNRVIEMCILLKNSTSKVKLNRELEEVRLFVKKSKLFSGKRKKLYKIIKSYKIAQFAK